MGASVAKVLFTVHYTNRGGNLNQSYGPPQSPCSAPLLARPQGRQDFFQGLTMCLAPAQRARDTDSTYCPDIGAEL